MTVTIAGARPGDLLALVEINRLAYCRETTAQFAFKDWPDETNMTEFFKARLAERFEHSGTQVFKAVDTATNTILGFVCLTLEKGNEAGNGSQRPATEMTPTAKVMQQLPPYMDHEFVLKTGTEIEAMKSRMGDGEHYCELLYDFPSHGFSDTLADVSAFAVEPRSQGKGIGSQLLKHCLDIADQASLQTWLISFPGSHSLYLRFGFRDMDHRDTDLGAWDRGKLRGYGLYRQYAMVRG